MAGGNKPIDIEHNVLVVGPGPNPNAGIATSSTTAAATVRYNTLLTEQDDFLLLAPGVSTTASANFCDGTKSDCASCIAAGQCEPFEHAVCGPTTYRLRVIGIGDQNQADSVVPSGVDVQYRWTLVNDYPDTGNIIGLAGATAVAYVGTGIGIGTDLFQVALYNAPDSMQFEKCTLRSHMMAEGAPGGTSPTWLVLKHAGTQNNGSQIDVQPTFIKEYTREMTTNPFTNQPWNSDDFTSSIYQIGVRNNVGTNRGITFLDLLLECQ